MNTLMTDFSFVKLAVSIFIVLNAVGQIPLFISILAPFDAKHQKKIIVRELIFALALLLLFNFFGNEILGAIGISKSVIGIAGGVLLFLIALAMLFPKASIEEANLPKQEPIFVPLAMPVITGPGAIAMIMLYAHETGKPFMVASAALCAWVPSVLILLLASNIRKVLGEKGLKTVEKIGGMIVCLIGIQMFTTGIVDLIKENFFN